MITTRRIPAVAIQLLIIAQILQDSIDCIEAGTIQLHSKSGHTPGSVHPTPSVLHPHPSIERHGGKGSGDKAVISMGGGAGVTSGGLDGDGIHLCAVTLPKGCSCGKNEGALSINCSSVRLTSVPRQWIDVGPSVVKTLNLERNAIREISDGDFFGIKIERLLLANNSLSELKFLSFWGLEYSLETLDLSYNQFRRAPAEALRLLRNLKFLSLTGNHITTLSDFDFGYMRKLEVLTLDKNPIAEVGKHSLVGTQLVLLVLDWIKLPDEKLSVFPTDDLKYLKGLSLAHNTIGDIPIKWFRNLKSLRYLNLEHNQLSVLRPDTFAGLEDTLRTLELNHNGLVRVPSEAIRGLINLEKLDLSYNKIKRIFRRAFNTSSNIKNLNLSHNRLSKISKRAFVGLDSIESIDLTNNKLITVDDRTFAWSNPKGKSVYLSGNPWLCNCIVRWIRDEFRKKTDLGSIFADDMICDRPSYLKGRALATVSASELHCHHDYYYYYTEKDGSNTGEIDEDAVGENENGGGGEEEGGDEYEEADADEEEEEEEDEDGDAEVEKAAAKPVGKKEEKKVEVSQVMKEAVKPDGKKGSHKEEVKEEPEEEEYEDDEDEDDTIDTDDIV